MLGGVSQRQPRRPLLFIIIVINNINDGIISQMSKFADDTELCRAVNGEEEVEKLLEDLRRIVIPEAGHIKTTYDRLHNYVGNCKKCKQELRS